MVGITAIFPSSSHREGKGTNKNTRRRGMDGGCVRKELQRRGMV